MTISHNLNFIHFVNNFEDKNLKVDDKLLEYCKLHSDTILITNDVYLKVKAIIANIKTEGYGGGEDYSGI